MMDQPNTAATNKRNPVAFWSVRSEEAKSEGRMPLAYFKHEEWAITWKDQYIRTGIIEEWLIDRDPTKDLLVAVAMRIVSDKLESPALRFRITELEQQVSNLEKYMLEGVAFRDELQARIAELEKIREEWSERFGFIATENPRDSIESIDEVAIKIFEKDSKLRDRIAELEKENAAMEEELRCPQDGDDNNGTHWCSQCDGRVASAVEIRAALAERRKMGLIKRTDDERLKNAGSWEVSLGYVLLVDSLRAALERSEKAEADCSRLKKELSEAEDACNGLHNMVKELEPENDRLRKAIEWACESYYDSNLPEERPAWIAELRRRSTEGSK